MDPQQELFTILLVGIKKMGYDVYDGGLPPEGTPYPFVYLAGVDQNDEVTKSQNIGMVYPTINVWHNNTRQRGTVSEMLAKIKALCQSIEKTPGCRWTFQRSSQRIMPDNTTKTPLVHGVLQPEYKFS